MPKFLVPIDMAMGEIQNVHAQNLSTDPGSLGSTDKGRFWFNTTSNTFKGADGTATPIQMSTLLDSVSGTAPIVAGAVSGKSQAISITAASGGAAGSMSSAHYSLVAGAASINTASALVLRDGSGNFSAGTITSALTGTASNATNLNSQPDTYYLSRANHSGTQVASTISNFDTQVRTSRLDQLAVPTSSVAMNSQKITGLLDPTSPQDGATKGYVDGVAAGLDVKLSVVAASTANFAATYTAGGGTSGRGQMTGAPTPTIDGVTLTAGQRVLLKNQTAGAQNGIWVCTVPGTGANGVWDRAVDFSADNLVTSGAFTFIEEGTVNVASGWVLTTVNPIIIGGASGTALSFSQFSPGLTAAFASMVPPPTGVAATDYANIQGAHDALPATGGILRLQAGTYALGTNALTFTKRVTLEGAGKADPLWRTWGTRLTSTSTTTDLITLAAHGCAIRRLALDNIAGSDPTAGSGIKVTVGDGTSIVDVAIQRFWVNIDIRDGAEGWVRDCFLYGPIKYGLYQEHTDLPDAGDWTFTGCQIIANAVNSDAAIYWASGGGPRINNNKINGRGGSRFTDGIRVSPVTGIATTVFLFNNNSIENITRHPLYVTVPATGTVALFNISNNEMMCNGGTSSAINIDASAGSAISQCIIHGNNLIKPSGAANTTPAINANNVAGLRITSNTTTFLLLTKRVNCLTTVITGRSFPILASGSNAGNIAYPTLNLWTDVLSVTLQDVAVGDVLRMTFVATMFGTAAADNAEIRFVIGSTVGTRLQLVGFGTAGTWVPVHFTFDDAIVNAGDIVSELCTVKVQTMKGNGTQANIFNSGGACPWLEVVNLYQQSLG